LYDKLSIGGYLIMDDWFGFPSKIAVEGESQHRMEIDNILLDTVYKLTTTQYI
jgi:hypothetical protein